MTHICVSKLFHHWFRQWLVAWTAPSHYLKQCWNVINWTIRNKPHWNLNRNPYIFFQENAFQYCVWKMATILSRPQCVKLKKKRSIWWRHYMKRALICCGTESTHFKTIFRVTFCGEHMTLMFAERCYWYEYSFWRFAFKNDKILCGDSSLILIVLHTVLKYWIAL